jgi:chromosome partitioning protein
MIRKIVVINSKGGCGKTTLSTNLVGFYAANGYPSALFDYDPQDSSFRWLSQRPEHRANIHGVAATHQPAANLTRSFQLRVPPETERVILDTPASLKRMDLIEILRGAAAIVVPILPSIIDSRVTATFIKDLAAEARVYAPTAPIAIVANRVRRNTRAFRTLVEFLNGIGKPPVACLRDSQNYVYAAEQGIGIHEMPENLTRVDRDQWRPLIDWLESAQPDAELLESRQETFMAGPAVDSLHRAVCDVQ